MFEIANRNWKSALWRGFRKSCPSCGGADMFLSYLGIKATCPNCGAALHHQRADDAPPYFTIFAVGHIVIPLMLLVEKLWKPELWIHFAMWLPFTVLLTLWLLPRFKGATVGIQWALRMHGFAAATESAPDPVRT
jgi:uncharacterized protein (DUF983 family)